MPRPSLSGSNAAKPASESPLGATQRRTRGGVLHDHPQPPLGSESAGLEDLPLLGPPAALRPAFRRRSGARRPERPARRRRSVPRDEPIRERVSKATEITSVGWILGGRNGRPWAMSHTKRALDLLVAIVAGGPLVALLLPPIALLIKLDSPGPVFFWQRRTGYRGRRFRMLKLRTMHVDAEARKAELRGLSHHGTSSPDFKLRDDPRVTRVGRVLRRYSLDELPNLYNVLIGELSLVGPRPTSFDIYTYEASHLTRLSVRPGITGLWQVSGRSEVPFDQRVQLDETYIREQSPWTDLKILLTTPLRVFDGWGAY